MVPNFQEMKSYANCPILWGCCNTNAKPEDKLHEEEKLSLSHSWTQMEKSQPKYQQAESSLIHKGNVKVKCKCTMTRKGLSWERRDAATFKLLVVHHMIRLKETFIISIMHKKISIKLHNHDVKTQQKTLSKWEVERHFLRLKSPSTKNLKQT